MKPPEETGCPDGAAHDCAARACKGTGPAGEPVVGEPAGDGSIRLKPRGRAFELDALRGLAVLMMILHHTVFDLRYLLGLDAFAWLESGWFTNGLRPLFLSVFILVSGVSSTFSRSNLKRGLRLGAVALGFTAATTLASLATGIDLFIFFNVLHVLAAGILLYWALTLHDRGPRTDAVLVLLTLLIFYIGFILPERPVDTWLLLPVGILPAGVPAMADYLPLFPWLSFFLAGTLIGRLLYRDRQTAFPGAPGWLLNASRPFMTLGRNSLWIYALHQPAILVILFGLRALGAL